MSEIALPIGHFGYMAKRRDLTLSGHAQYVVATQTREAHCRTQGCGVLAFVVAEALRKLGFFFLRMAPENAVRKIPSMLALQARSQATVRDIWYVTRFSSDGKRSGEMG
jgi:hypothetical protein